MEHICGKDDHPHHNTSRNKQNALCNGRSIWDVVKQSDDFKTTQQQPDDLVPENIQFSYIQESKPRFVVLLENSDNLHEQLFAIPFALRRFYYDLPARSKLALYTYNSEVAEALPYKELSAEVRSDLGTFVDFGSPAKSICTSCGLAKAAQFDEQRKLKRRKKAENESLNRIELPSKVSKFAPCVKANRHFGMRKLRFPPFELDCGSADLDAAQF
ncbi:hypothetical protein AVEN_108095-1 [Araneus ventricosus]|uniref:Calcium-activated chloride channel N-terminal domain-containing protein n=1 Tax=Araneus ventricosus TaxID=182803 RepID=A0A4Y2QVB1_ARAVE|nr:hypothetical protein AVEN_108095-1 [Araneus ventricosus]